MARIEGKNEQHRSPRMRQPCFEQQRFELIERVELDFERHEMAELGARVNAASILPAAQL